MSKIIYLTVASALLGIAGCTPDIKEAQQPVDEPAAVEQTTPALSAGVSTIKPLPVKPVEEKPVQLGSTPQQPAPAPAPAPAPKSTTDVPPPTVSITEVLSQEQALNLARVNNCLACHKLDRKLVGPAWNAVGAKYQGDPNAAKIIAANIKSGGSFGWKFGSMPPRGAIKISDNDIDKLAKYIATLR